MQVADILCAYVSSQSDKEQPVVRLASPDALKRHFEEAHIPLELEDGQAATPVDSLLAGVSTALQYSVRTGHPGFFNQLYARADAVSIAADWLAVAANTNVHTYEVAPVFTAVEVEVLSKLARCIGGQYTQRHDGLFAPGGSISNIYGENTLLLPNCDEDLFPCWPCCLMLYNCCHTKTTEAGRHNCTSLCPRLAQQKRTRVDASPKRLVC